MTNLYGMPVFVNDMLGWHYEQKQVRFPRSKKRRIRNKWKKQDKNWSVKKWQEPEAYRMGNSFIMNSPAFGALKKRAAALEPLDRPAT